MRTHWVTDSIQHVWHLRLSAPERRIFKKSPWVKIFISNLDDINLEAAKCHNLTPWENLSVWHKSKSYHEMTCMTFNWHIHWLCHSNTWHCQLLRRQSCSGMKIYGKQFDLFVWLTTLTNDTFCPSHDNLHETYKWHWHDTCKWHLKMTHRSCEEPW